MLVTVGVRRLAASGCWLTASMPSMNFTPVISFGNWLWPSETAPAFLGCLAHSPPCGIEPYAPRDAPQTGRRSL
jgi:hypothetical protein